MNRLLRARALRISAGAIALSALAAAAGCDQTEDVGGDPSAETNTPDSGKDSSTTPPRQDAGTGTTTDAAQTADASDAAVEAEAAAPQGCALHTTASFCDDFDNAGALTVGTTKWEFIEQSEQPVVTLSTTRAVSTPNALLTQIIDGTSPGAKFAKTLTKANFTEVTWDYDIYLESVGTGAGFFLDDLQFAEGDAFGFRLVILAEDGAIGTFRVEHNHPILGGNDDFEPAAEGTVQLGKWHHFTQTTKFTFGSDGGASMVAYSLTVDGATTPAIQKTYRTGTRDQIAFARFAGMPFVFDKAASAGLKIYWDNQVFDIK